MKIHTITPENILTKIIKMMPKINAAPADKAIIFHALYTSSNQD
jgi:hypothetical protein